MQRKKFLILLGIAIALSLLVKFLFPQHISQKLTASCDNDICQPQAVVVLHGLVRSSASMGKISRAINNAGYTVCNIQYPSRQYSIQKLASDYVLPEIQQCLPDGQQQINFVTHSMGGIILRQLARSTELNIGCAVMLSPPNQGSELVDKLKIIPFFKLINGEAGLSLGTKNNSVPNSLGRVNFDLGVITGDRSYNPLYSYLIPGADDGKVSVNRAKIKGMKDFLVIPYSHSFIMNSKIAIKQTINFLQSSQFIR